jgi:hypothetical protein
MHLPPLSVGLTAADLRRVSPEQARQSTLAVMVRDQTGEHALQAHLIPADTTGKDGLALCGARPLGVFTSWQRTEQAALTCKRCEAIHAAVILNSNESLTQ